MQWKSLVAPVLFFLALISLNGCGGTSDTAGEPLPRYGHVRVACPSWLGTSVVQTYGRNWENQTEGTIEIVSYDPQREDPPDADIWLIPSATLPRWAAVGKLRTLPDSIATSDDYLWRTLVTLYREKLLVWDRKRYAVPVLGESLLCCYRSDWLANPEHQAAFEAKYHHKLEPPATWEQYADIAEYFSRNLQPRRLPKGTGQAEGDDERERRFYTIAANYAARAISDGEAGGDDRALFSFQYDVATGEPRLASGGFVYALQLMKRMENPLSAGYSRNPADAFGAGEAAIGLLETAQMAAIQERWKNPSTLCLPLAAGPACLANGLSARVGVCRMPCANGYFDFSQTTKWVALEGNRIPYLGAGGWLGVVPKCAADEAAAFSLLTYLTSPAVSKQIVIDRRMGGGPTRQEHFGEATHWETFGLSGEQTAKAKDALREMLEHPGLKNPAIRLRTPDEAEHRLALQEELRAALTGAKTPEQALQDAATRWKKMDERKGMAAHRADYRLSLGLLGDE